MESTVKTGTKGNKKNLFYIWLSVLIIWLLFILIPSLFKQSTGVFILDSNEYASYYDRGGWIYSSGAPVSEYPQIPTYLFGLNRLISDSFSPDMHFGIFYTLFSLEMITVLFFVIKILIEMLPQTDKSFYLLLFLPPTLYYVLNRFDILPALLCLIALHKAHEKKWIFASALLAVATFTKWYPILLFPGFFVYASIQENKLNWKMVMAFIVASLVILLPTFLQGGLAAVMIPYRFHLARGMEYVALPVLVNDLLVNMIVNPQAFYFVFFVLQVVSPVLCIFLKVDTFDRLVNYCILSTSIFILFSRINSPQWFLWLIPFLLLSITNKKDYWLVVFYNLITYIFFPIVFNMYGNSSTPLKILAGIIYLILAILIIRSVKRITFVPGSFLSLIRKRVNEKTLIQEV
jgi:hypothetical protein